MDLTIDWRMPFELAFELALFLLGSTLVLFVVLVSTMLIYGLVRAFFGAMRAASSSRNKSADPAAGRTKLKPVV